MGLYDKIFKPKKLVLANGKVVEEKCSRAPLIIIHRDRNMDLCESYRFFHDNTCDENTVFL